jgi:dTDP-4-amino-4,6-dideoxygalactose transaminase
LYFRFQVLLVNSGTAALEMASLIIGSEAGVEVIMPSFTFTSTANAFVIHGAWLSPLFIVVHHCCQNAAATPTSPYG